MASTVFSLTDVGEGLEEAEIVEWKVAVGDQVALNQGVVDVETAKSVVELPSPVAGRVVELLAAVGEEVTVGSPLVRFETAEAGGVVNTAPVNPAPVSSAPVNTAPVNPAPASSVSQSSDTAQGTISMSEVSDLSEVSNVPDGSSAQGQDSEPSHPNLVGYGKAPKASSRRRDRHAAPRDRSVPRISRPPIRKLAKRLGVDLTSLNGSGAAGQITREDVVSHARQDSSNARQDSVFHNTETPKWPVQREERIRVHGVRRTIAKAMTASAFTAPHVTVFVDVDATRTMEYVRRLKTSPDYAGVKVSPLLIMSRAVVWAVQRNPEINASYDGDEITVHHYVNLGIAAATPRGLIVPNLKDVQRMTLRELAASLGDLISVARSGRTRPEDMRGGTITITNIGPFGVDTGTPILNPGECAIVALGAIRQKPWVVDGRVEARDVTTVAVSVDHRVVDGDVVSRFAADIASILTEPALLLE